MPLNDVLNIIVYSRKLKKNKKCYSQLILIYWLNQRIRNDPGTFADVILVFKYSSKFQNSQSFRKVWNY